MPDKKISNPAINANPTFSTSHTHLFPPGIYPYTFLRNLYRLLNQTLQPKI